MLSSSKRLQLPNPFLPLLKLNLILFFHSQLKSALGPAGNRSSFPWAWCTTALTITPPCQLLNSHTFFLYRHHSTTTTNPVTFLFYPILFLSLLSQLTLRLLKGLGAQARNQFSRSLGFEHHSLDHYTTMAKAKRF